jgi:high-affinity nickel-transport protein
MIVSAAVAPLMRDIETLGLIRSQFSLCSAFWSAIHAVNDHFGMIGYLIIGAFVFTCRASVFAYRVDVSEIRRQPA